MTRNRGEQNRPHVLLAFLFLSGGVGACTERRYHPAPYTARSISIPTCPSAANPVRGVFLDTDRLLETDAGRGTGVFVEYTAGGHWHIWTVCDTLISGYGCTYDVTGQVIGGKVSNILAEEIEGDDLASSACADTAYLTVATGSDFDGMWFDAPAGATLRVTAALGRTLYPNLIYWISEGAAHSDANANPLELTPTAP